MHTSCLPRGVPSPSTGFALAGFGWLGPFLQRHGRPSSRERLLYSATVMAIAAGYIEKMPRVFMPAASSNGSPKGCYRRGPKA